MLKRLVSVGGLGGRGGWPVTGDFEWPKDASEGSVLGGVVEPYAELSVDDDLVNGTFPLVDPFVEPLVLSDGALWLWKDLDFRRKSFKNEGMA